MNAKNYIFLHFITEVSKFQHYVADVKDHMPQGEADILLTIDELKNKFIFMRGSAYAVGEIYGFDNPILVDIMKDMNQVLQKLFEKLESRYKAFVQSMTAAAVATMDAVDPNLELMKKAKFRKQPLLQPYTSVPSTIELKPGQIVVTPWLIPPSNIHKKPVYFYIQSVVLKPNGFTSMYGWRLSEQQKLTVRYEKLREEIADQYTYIVEENVSESRLNEEE